MEEVREQEGEAAGFACILPETYNPLELCVGGEEEHNSSNDQDVVAGMERLELKQKKEEEYHQRLAEKEAKRKEYWQFKRRQQKERRRQRKQKAKAAPSKEEAEEEEAEEPEACECSEEERAALRQQRRQRKEALEAQFVTHKPRVVVDLSFDGVLSLKEVRSVANQINFCYGGTRSSKRPLELHITSVEGRIEEALLRHAGYDRWHVGKHREDYLHVFAEEKEKLVYLSPDAETVLEVLDEDKIYIVGGIADVNIKKGLTYHKAKAQGIPSARLPLRRFSTVGRTVLNINHVVDILTEVAENGDWEAAFDRHVPVRKVYQHSALRKQENENENENENEKEN
ncbi:tRNA methyltransferase 10 [Balamuthia mandrillaris]